ncbi:MAG: thymidine kinase [Planctomycetes bacterium]|nr:thymidine kinase [Planctomycetota bacterium]
MRTQAGRIELICGPMFAGKTTALIRILGESAENGHRVLAVKPSSDTRYGEDQIVTHDGKRIPAVRVDCTDELLTSGESAEVIGIDEVHFFDVELAGVCEKLAGLGVRVICAGVDLDHHGQPFDVIDRLETIADEVVRLTATCSICGERATHTKRLVSGESRIVVGGVGAYEPRCADCFDRTADASGS